MASRIRISEGADPQPQLLWDSIWDAARGIADWALAAAAEIFNRGGLQATSAIETAVVIQYFTDRRMGDDHPLRKYVDDGDLRGWWGDGVDVRTDLGEQPMGSLLWVLQRMPLNEDTQRWAETLGLDALQPLLAQKIAARIDVRAVMDKTRGALGLDTRIYRSDGSLAVDKRFDVLWAQLT